MPPTSERLIVEFADAEAWANWLEDNHATTPDGVWIRHAKKATGIPSVTHPEALEVAICFGWIDAQRLPDNETHYLQRYTPRRPRSKWSQRNRDWATKLIAQGRMRPAGLAEVEAAKRDGRWDAAYPPQSASPIPPDFQQALDENPEAKAFFATLTGTRRYSFLYRLHNVSRPDTRAKRIAGYIERLNNRKTLQDD
jgi:uncharacterized protein YdeI (YjbR/CyaY-like superfamily)